jgi:hypothetical protein
MHPIAAQDQADAATREAAEVIESALRSAHPDGTEVPEPGGLCDRIHDLWVSYLRDDPRMCRHVARTDGTEPVAWSPNLPGISCLECAAAIAERSSDQENSTCDLCRVSFSTSRHVIWGSITIPAAVLSGKIFPPVYITFGICVPCAGLTEEEAEQACTS